MKNIKKTIILILALFSFIQAFPQDKTIIRGRVVDKADKSAIIGANIIEYDSEERVVSGTVTDVNGNFVYTMVNPENIVKVRVIGYNEQTIEIDPASAIVIELTSSDVEIAEVTVTAEAQTGNRLTNIDERDKASSSVKIDLVEMHDAGIVSAADALQGRVTGLDIISASGDPGSGSQLVIRGLSGMGNSQPLIVIDGIPQMRVNRNELDISSANMEDISELINIALQDIKSIEVLKDAASTAVYGSRGADGVLLIETHKGRMGKVQFDYTYKYSLNYQPPPIPLLTGDEYIMLQLEEWHNSQGVFDVPSEIAYDRDYADFYNYSANTDWLGALTQNGMTHDHFFKVSGGGDKTRYYTSFSYVDEGGTTLNTGANRFSTRINLDYHLSNKLMFSIQFNYNRNKIQRNPGVWTSYGAVYPRRAAFTKAPNMSIWEYDENGNPTGEYFTPINSYQGSGATFFNPVAVATLGKHDEVYNSLQNTFILRYRINDWLTFNETVSLQYQGQKSKDFLPYNAMGTDWLDWVVNKAEEVNGINYSINTESQLLFTVPIRNESHYLAGSAAWITRQTASESINIQSNKTPSVNIQDPAIDAQVNYIGSWSGESRDLGGFVSFNYKFKDRYLIQASARADANSSFGINNRWGLFPGVSIGWRFSEESWLDTWDFLGESKATFSWGIAGRQPGSSYARFATYGSSGNYIEGAAVTPSSIQLSNLKWESVVSYNLALELNMFKDRFYLKAETYFKTTYDLLFNRYSIPSSSGFSSLGYFNGGELENKGWELMLDYQLIKKDNFSLSLNFNTSHNVNAFKDLPDNFVTERDVSIGNGQYPKRVVEGEPIGSFFGFKYLGVWPSDQDVKATDADGHILVDGEGKPIPFSYMGVYNFKGGDAIYEDVNHDGKIDLNDVVYIGDSNPDFMGGFGANLRYKNWDFSCAFYYRTGFDIVNMVALDTEGMDNRDNQSKAVLSRWRVQGQDEPGMLPRAYMNHPCNNLGSDRYVEAGDYLRLNNVKLGYRLSRTLCNKLGIRNAAFALSARKLLTFTNYSGQDPEVGQNASDPFWIGQDNANTPPPKIVTFTLSFGF